jgi:hypothetical protein
MRISPILRLLVAAAALSAALAAPVEVASRPRWYDLDILMREPHPFAAVPGVAPAVPASGIRYFQPLPISQMTRPGTRTGTAPVRRPPISGVAGSPVAGMGQGLKGIELGARVVISTGQTDWNHTTSTADPTSVLIYKDVNAYVLEIHGKVPLPQNSFIRANVGLGIGEIGDGNLRDDDFGAGQVLTSSTDSVISDTDLFYFTVDVGREVVRFRDGKGSLSLFTGFQYWTEEYEAFGVFNRLSGAQTVSTSTPVISNEVEWWSLRVGAMGSYKLNDEVSWSADVAFIPYADMHNEDSHLLRTDLSDLGPVPNIIMDGDGWGFQGEIGVSYLFAPNWKASLDFRYWALMSDGDIVFGPNSTTPSASLPLNDLDTYRYGVAAGIAYRF